MEKQIEDVEKKTTPNVSGLVTTTTLNKKIGEVKNTIQGDSGLVTTTILNTKIGEDENKISDIAKYIATPEFTIFLDAVFDTKFKQVNLAKNDDLNTVEQRVDENYKKNRKTTNI